MNFKGIFLTMIFGILLGFLFVNPVSAAEVLTEEDFVKKVVVEDNFIKMADNFVILFDTSSSMAEYVDKGAKTTKYDVARKILKQKLAQLPDLGYNGFTQAVDSLPAQPKGATFLPQALRNIETELQQQSGKTVVFIFTDGTSDFAGATKDPEDYTQAFADKYNVCFYMIGDATNSSSKKRLTDMAKANACSRVISFQKFVENPEYITGALYVVKATEKIVTISDQKVVGLKTDNILFAFDKADLEEPYLQELDEIGMFLQKQPEAFLSIEGYADEVGDPEYNMQLSRRRAESAANYLMQKYNIDSSRLVLNWYGSANPVAGNDSIDGRAQNRRVELAIGGL